MVRTFGIGMDYSPSSKAALEWAINNLGEDGDHVILIHVLSTKSDSAHKKLWGKAGPPLIPLDEFKKVCNLYGFTPDAKVLSFLDTVSRTKEIKVESKIYWGDPEKKLCAAVEDLKLDSLVLGNRDLGKFKRALLGSVSIYVVTNATCPVTVVKGTPTSRP
ncbi:hypothetical protein GIB67_006225 [Kingdonia uniflora]|uniref:UspA domain-containing protein n=1 Tax=Kingdonia uniflora TaxID=39325 RepID=A0A7J7P5H2_9MAGN|nr:hypothetical protein GIB67_006225 [Kingdonia uniflora]